MKDTEVVGYIPKLLFKFYLKLKDRFDPPKNVSEEEKICYEICKKLILDTSSKLTMAPMSNKRYIKNDGNNMFIVISNGNIMIVNHVYSYNVYCDFDENYEKLLKLFDGELEKKRMELETEINSNIQHSLKKILDNLSI